MMNENCEARIIEKMRITGPSSVKAKNELRTYTQKATENYPVTIIGVS